MRPSSGRPCCVLATRDPQSHRLLSSASDASVQPSSLGPGHCDQPSGFRSGKPSAHPTKRRSVPSAAEMVALPTRLTCPPVFLARLGHVSVPTAQSTGAGAQEPWLGMEREGKRTREGPPTRLASRCPMNAAFFSSPS